MRAAALTAPALLLALLAPAPAAHAGDVGVLCQHTSVRGSTDAVSAGPLVVDRATYGDGAVTITCSVHRWADVRHSDPVYASATSEPTTSAVVVLAPVLLPVPESYVTVCTRLDVAGVGAFYFSAADGDWSRDPDTYCDQDIPPGGPYNPLWDNLDPLWDDLDAIVCPLLAGPLEPLRAVWECPA
jgi:hypothetical protein